MTGDERVVLIVDDDASVRASLDSLLRSVGYRVSMVGSAAELLDKGVASDIGCLVVDIRLPGLSGLELQAALSRAGAVVPIVFMTGHGDVEMSVRAMKLGAVDFLTKPYREQDMLDAVAAAMDRDRRQRETDRASAGVRAAFSSLTTREREVMTLVTAGLMNKRIAVSIGISEITVKIHRGHVMRKMGARSLADLVRMADALGLKKPGPAD